MPVVNGAEPWGFTEKPQPLCKHKIPPVLSPPGDGTAGPPFRVSLSGGPQALCLRCTAPLKTPVAHPTDSMQTPDDPRRWGEQVLRGDEGVRRCRSGGAGADRPGLAGPERGGQDDTRPHFGYAAGALAKRRSVGRSGGPTGFTTMVPIRRFQAHSVRSPGPSRIDGRRADARRFDRLQPLLETGNEPVARLSTERPRRSQGSLARHV
jgi:hypothetical protein